MVEGCPIKRADGLYVSDGEEWDDFPVYKQEGTKDRALYWQRQSDKWILARRYSELTDEQKKGGRGNANCKADLNHCVPVAAYARTWSCYIDGKWTGKQMTVRARAPSEAPKEDLEAAFDRVLQTCSAMSTADRAKRQQAFADEDKPDASSIIGAATLTGLTAGLGYLSTRRVDLTMLDVEAVPADQLLAVAEKVPQLEALFLPPHTQLDETTIRQLRQMCPEARCLALGCELSEEAYLDLRAQYRGHDIELETALMSAGLAQPDPTDRTVATEPEPEEVAPDQNLLGADYTAIPHCSEPELGVCTYDVCRVLDLTGAGFDRLTDAGFAEIPRLCPNITALFLPAGSLVTSVGLDEFRTQSPDVKVLAIGRELSRGALLRLMRQAREKYLDFTSPSCSAITETGLRELVAIAPLSDMRAVFFPTQLRERAATLLDSMQSVLDAHFVEEGKEICFAVRTEAVDAKRRLSDLQDRLRLGVQDEVRLHVGLTALQQRRDDERRLFIAAATAFTEALAPGSALSSHIQPSTRNECLPKPDLDAWRRAEAEAQQIAVIAAECQRVLDAAEPKRTTDALEALKNTNTELRAAVDACRARIVLLQQDLQSSPRPAHGDQLRRAHSTEEQREARKVLLSQPMARWSEIQVQEWIGLIGLAPEQLEVVLHALAKDSTDGEDLDEMTRKRLQKLLKRDDVENHAQLAETTMELHEAAQGDTSVQGKLQAERELLVSTSKALRNNQVAVRSCVTELVALASQHFPELLRHDDVKMFMGSDGLQVTGRRLTDYDDRQPIVIGRTSLILCKRDDKQVVLKEFPLQSDMRSYLKEIINVRRLQHPNIISYSAVFEDDRSMFIEMEYCKRGSVLQWMHSANPDEAQKQSVLRQVLLGLACMHSQNIVHCDIKADNILVTEDGSVRICDFEMSKDLSATVSTMAGGTLGFIAPEVKDRKQTPSPASDMYSFGVLALNLLFPHVATDYPLTDASVAAGTPHSWVSKLLKKDPSRRSTAVRLLASLSYFDSGRVALPQEWTSVTDAFGVEMIDVPDKCGFFEERMKESSKSTPSTAAAQRMDTVRVQRVVRVENAPLFANYQHERAKIQRRMDTCREAGNAVTRLDEHALNSLMVDKETNEFVLWHGTSPTIPIKLPDGTVQQQNTWEVLARHGFDERVASDRGLYGLGSYFADASSKSHQYARIMNKDGQHCMLSCRVTMGDPYLTQGTLRGQRRPPNNPATPGLPYDSVFAMEGVTDNGRGYGSQFHNEYVVFAKAQVYPEYVIWYTK